MIHLTKNENSEQNASNQESKILLVSLMLDINNQIIAVSDSWDCNAKIGHAKASVYARNILGKNLQDYISSDETVMYIDTALKLTRLTDKIHYKPYRCDSPTHKRFMEMEITPLANGELSINHFLLFEEPFSKPLFLQDVSQQSVRPISYLMRCSLCNDLKDPVTDEWLMAEKFDAQESAPISVIHTVCPSCKEKRWSTRT